MTKTILITGPCKYIVNHFNGENLFKKVELFEAGVGNTNSLYLQQNLNMEYLFMKRTSLNILVPSDLLTEYVLHL